MMHLTKHLTESKITLKGQISVPAVVRRRLDLTPGARIEWLEKDGEVIVRRASQFSSQDINQAIFPENIPTASVEDMDAGIRHYLQKKYASD